jgi:hypothetical protein
MAKPKRIKDSILLYKDYQKVQKDLIIGRRISFILLGLLALAVFSYIMIFTLIPHPKERIENIFIITWVRIFSR